MAKIRLIESTDKFVEVLQRSQLFDPEQLEAIKKLADTAEDTLPIARTLVKNGWLTKWQASQLLSGFFNLTYGKYRLADQLGKGELGNVYLAENPKLGRQVALKTLSRKHTDDAELVKRFLNEARAAASLDHRNIVHVHDVGSEGQRHYVVMEYVRGCDLQSRIDTDGPLAFDDAISVISQAAEGLQHAHEQGIIHRDIKPGNVMIDDQGVVKILDIGVGHLRRSEDNSSDNTAVLMMSAIAYMAPEHVRGQQVDARCDVYSLGGILYFLLTGRAPFSAKTEAERARIKELKRPLPIADLRADTPPSLVELCDRMMALKPGDRPASMREVLAVLASSEDVAPDASTSDNRLEKVEAETISVSSESREPVAESTNRQADPGAAPAIKIDVGDGAKPAAAAIPADFAINTKRRKKKKTPAKASPAVEATTETTVDEQTVDDETGELAATSEDAAGGDDKAEQPASPAPKKGLSKAVMIGGACAAGLLLLTGVGIGAVMLLGGKDVEVAQSARDAGDGDSETAQSTESTDATASEVSEEDGSSAATSEFFGDPAQDAAAEASADSDSGDAAAVVPSSAAEAAAPAADAAAPDTGSASTPAPAGSTTEAPQAKPLPETPAPEQPAEMKPADEKPAETKPEEPAAAPAPEKKEPEKKPPPKPKTFVFQKAVDLPTPASDAPELTLGQINIGPADAVFISMDGGDIAASGRLEFSLQNAQGGVAPRDWEFYLSDGNSDPVVIATMSLPEKELQFKWAAAAIQNPMATNLRNCSLRITAGQDQPQDLALRTAHKVPPVSIDLERSATVKLPLEGAPDRDSLKMEVTVKGHKSLIEPAQIGLGKGDGAFIYFGENQEQAALALKIDVSVNARGVQIKTDPYFLVPVEKSPVRLNKASMKRYETAQAQQAGLQNQVFEGQKAISGKQLSPQDKARGQVILAELKQRLELINKTVEKMAQLNTDMAAVSSGAALEFRVFSDTFEKQIDLIVTDPNAAPVTP